MVAPQSLLLSVPGKLAEVKSRQATVIKADPQVSIATLVQIYDMVVGKRVRIIHPEGDKAQTIEPRQTSESSHPKIPVMGLDKRVHQVFRQAVRTFANE